MSDVVKAFIAGTAIILWFDIVHAMTDILWIDWTISMIVAVPLIFYVSVMHDRSS